MNYKAAALFDRNMPYGSEANIAKLIASQAASTAIENAMQTLGGMGFAKETHLERLWRDARLFRFAPISEQMILNFIAQQNSGLPRSDQRMSGKAGAGFRIRTCATSRKN